MENVELLPGEDHPARPGFAVDSNGDAYVTYERGGKDAEEHGTKEQCAVHPCTTAEVKLSEEAGGLEAVTENGELGDEGASGLAVDLAGEAGARNDVYLDNGWSVAAFSAAGTLIQRFGAGVLEGGSGWPMMRRATKSSCPTRQRARSTCLQRRRQGRRSWRKAA